MKKYANIRLNRAQAFLLLSSVDLCLAHLSSVPGSARFRDNFRKRLKRLQFVLEETTFALMR